MELTADDTEYSEARPGERMREQSLRNIQSHHAGETNFIYRGYLEHIPGGGYAATENGLMFLKCFDRERG